MSSESDDLISGFSAALQRYQAAVDDWDRTVARSLGINETDARCLEVLLFDHRAGVTPAQLGTVLGLTSGSVTTMVDRLVRADYARREPHPADRRTVLVVATEHAAAAAIGVHRSLLERGRALLGEYSASDLVTMTDFFARATALQREEEARLRAAGS